MGKKRSGIHVQWEVESLPDWPFEVGCKTLNISGLVWSSWTGEKLGNWELSPRERCEDYPGEFQTPTLFLGAFWRYSRNKASNGPQCGWRERER